MSKTSTKIAASKQAVADHLKRTGMSGRALAAAAGLSKNAINMGLSPERQHWEFDADTIAALIRAGVTGLAPQPTPAAPVAAPPPASGAKARQGKAPPAVPAPPAAGGAGPAAESVNRILVSFDQLVLSGLNYRKTIDEAALTELAANIETHGVLQNLVVRPKPGSPGRFEILAGERRYRAVQLLVREKKWLAGARQIPVLVRELQDAEAVALALIENLQREDVNYMEEAEAFASLNRLDPQTWTTQAIADTVRKSLRYVQQAIQMATRLDDKVKAAAREGTLPKAFARELVIAKPKEQLKLLPKVGNYGARTADELRDQLTRNLPEVRHALFDLQLYTGDYVEPDGDDIPHRLFADKQQFDKLQAAAVESRKAKLEKQWKWVEIQRGSWFRDYDYSKSKDKKKAGAVIFIATDGKATTHTGLVKKKTSGGSATASEPRESKAAREAREQAEAARQQQLEAFELQLQEKVAAYPDLAFRVLLMAVIDRRWCSALDRRQFGNGLVAARFRDDLPGIVFSDSFDDLSADPPVRKGMHADYMEPADLWDNIACIDLQLLQKVAGACIAGCIDCGRLDEEDEPVIRKLAEMAGVPLPPCLGGPQPAEQQEAA